MEYVEMLAPEHVEKKALRCIGDWRVNFVTLISTNISTNFSTVISTLMFAYSLA